MSLAAFLGRLIPRLDQAGAPYMVTGSVASALHGLPRTTQDVDLVVDLDRARLAELIALLPWEEFFVSLDASSRPGSMFNVLDRTMGWKADLFVCASRAFSREELGRRARAEILGRPLWVVSAEDCVLSKLEWAMKTRSERHFRDAAGIVDVQGALLDCAYLDRQAAELGVTEGWGRLRPA